MIHSIRIQNFKSLRDVTLRLQDVSLLIGPNNSGKSNVLKALAFLGRYLNGHYPDNEELKRLSFQHKIEEDGFPLQFTISYQSKKEFHYYDLKIYYDDSDKNEGKYEEIFGANSLEVPLNQIDVIDKFKHYVTFKFEGFDVHRNHIIPNNTRDIKNSEAFKKSAFPREKLNNLKNIRLYNIKLSAFTGKTNGEINQIKSDASNLMSYLDYLNNNHPHKLDKIAEELNRCISDFKLVRTPIIDPDKKDGIRQVKLFDKNGIGFWADEVSEGTLYFLALLCIIFQPNPPSILMLEEPEKGIHPRRIHEVMEYIFELAEEQGVQIILTSHSSEVVHKFKDLEEHIFIVDKPDNETTIKNLQADVIDDLDQKSKDNNSPKINYRKALGEYWKMGLFGGVPA